MKLSNKLTIISAIMTLFLVLLILGRVIGTECFKWLDYLIMFGTLFGNLGINILSAIGK
jgi:hypothetical protein